jgi:endonuclease/exonuclease/phosphatase family metal-dependent hydrolase
LAFSCLAISFASGTELTFATYNVENYTATNRMTSVGYRREYPKSEKSKAALRRVIKHLDADVVVLQEMGPRAYLNELQRDLRSEDVEYPYLFLAEASDEIRHVAMLSKRPILRVQTHTDLNFKYFEGRERVKRGLLEAVFATPAGEVTLWSIHLKSRYEDRKDDPDSVKRRAGEATAIRNFILKQFPDPGAARFLILGDFNDV